MGRNEIWGSIGKEHWDLVVIGGGITGAGVAREAARRGLRVLLVEQRDYAWGTSSRSSKMVHGGLRYVAQGDIRLTWHSLTERERLLTEAPGLVTRMGYWFAHYKGKFPGRYVFGALLAVYDVLAGVRDHRFMPRAGFLKRMPGYRSDSLTGASRYTDALVDDSRLVMRVLDEAREDGAVTLNYVKAVDLVQTKGKVTGLSLQDEESGAVIEVQSRAVVNATGAWADRLRGRMVNEVRVRPQRGSHIVIPRERLPIDEAVIFMHEDDKRPLFIYPWEGRTVVGTTDLDHREDLDVEASITGRELEYMLRGANCQFPDAHLVAEDVIATFSGVRPIVASGSGVNPSRERRDHSVWDNNGLVTVTGGKLTTFRLIALDTLKLVAKHIPSLGVTDTRAPVFRTYPAPGKKDGVNIERLEGRFGFRVVDFLREMQEGDDEVLSGVETLWAEIRWALRHEEVVHLDDLLLRRTRIGLLVKEGGKVFWPRLEVLCRQELGWNEQRWRAEVTRYESIWRRHYSLPHAEVG